MSDSINQLITEVFVEQPLASPGSANDEAVFRTAPAIPDTLKMFLQDSFPNLRRGCCISRFFCSSPARADVRKVMHHVEVRKSGIKCWFEPGWLTNRIRLAASGEGASAEHQHLEERYIC